MVAFLERGVFLQALSARLDGARNGSGALVFIGGEAGVGKTTLVRKFCEIARDAARIAWGICDPLSTPGALGPVVEIAAVLDEGIARSLVDPRRRRSAFRSLLGPSHVRGRPSVLVLEDLHWADAATLDFLQFAGRRIGETTILMCATYRDDELQPAHPLRVLLGDLATSGAVHRIAVPPLSEAAVRTLADGSGLDPVSLHRRTGGNPFFVTEVLASGATHIPATVLDAVLARTSRLSRPALAALEACAVIGSRIELWLLERAAAPAARAVDECISRGMLRAEAETLAFRHELAREAILHSMSSRRGAPSCSMRRRRRSARRRLGRTGRRHPSVRARSGLAMRSPWPSGPGCSNAVPTSVTSSSSITKRSTLRKVRCGAIAGSATC